MLDNSCTDRRRRRKALQIRTSVGIVTLLATLVAHHFRERTEMRATGLGALRLKLLLRLVAWVGWVGETTTTRVLVVRVVEVAGVVVWSSNHWRRRKPEFLLFRSQLRR